MKRLNWKQILGMVMLSVVLTVVTVQTARFIPRYLHAKEAKTDFGDFSGDSDFGGGWDSGSSWDWDLLSVRFPLSLSWLPKIPSSASTRM